MSDWARPFRITWPDNLLQDETLHGVQFPDGFCFVRNRWTNVVAATAFEHLGEQLDMTNALVEWQDGGGAERDNATSTMEDR